MLAWTSRPLPELPATGPRRRIQAFDSASRHLLAAGPESGEVRMYVCGITPYDATHIGHANTYVAFDLLNRAWRDNGLTVNYVQNVTDVDDPLLERAAQTGVDWQELAADQIALFHEDMTALAVIPPDDYVGVVESVPAIAEDVRALLASGAAYTVDVPDVEGSGQDVYYAVG